MVPLALGFCGAMGNDASSVTVVDVCRGSLVRARVWARGRSKVILLHISFPILLSRLLPKSVPLLVRAVFGG